MARAWHETRPSVTRLNAHVERNAKGAVYAANTLARKFEDRMSVCRASEVRILRPGPA